jgi:pimeloyl-ACP methyl ester carboxylesterase
MHAFYLHGFASSPRSSKAAFLARKLQEHDVDLHTPDFNEPDFSTLTITRMIGQVGQAIDRLTPASVVLIGSSLGAFVAVQVAIARPSQIDRLVLLAPALDFGAARETENPQGVSPETSTDRSVDSSQQVAGRSRTLGGKSVEEWQRTNRLDIFHYAYGRMMNVHYQLYSDACGYDCVNAALSMPIQIFQGWRDDAVDPKAVERWSRSRPNVELHMLDDDHQLASSLDYIWREMQRFLAL